MWITCFLLKIAEFTDNKTLIGRISILIDIPKILDIHHRSVVYLSINYGNQNACILRATPTNPWLPILLIHVGSEVKDINFKNLPKNNILKILQKSFHGTHLLELLDMMYKHEIDPASIVEDTEQTPFCPQRDGQTDKLKPVYPFQLRWNGGYKIVSDIQAVFACKIRKWGQDILGYQ